jgi:hypothetical protein
MLFAERGFWLGKQHPPGRPPSIFLFPPAELFTIDKLLYF